MRTRLWYEARSKCPDGQSHRPTEVTTLLDEFVGWICASCLNSVRLVRRGSDMWFDPDAEVAAGTTEEDDDA